MSLTTRILLLVALALVPALAIQGYNEFALRTSRGAAVNADTLATARGVTAELSQLAEGIHQALDLVSEDPSIRSGDAVACAAYLKRAAARLPHVLMLSLFQVDGSVICNSGGSAPGTYSNAERTYQHRAVSENAFVMGGYARGIATGRASIHFAQPERAENGRPTGVLVAAVDLDWLSDHLQSGLRQSSSALLVTDPDGTIIVRRPDAADWIGRKIPPERQARLVAQGAGVRFDIGLDGRPLIIATTTPGGILQGVRVVVGRDRNIAFADVDQATQRGFILIGLGAALALTAALLGGRMFIRRPVNRLLRAADAWQGGDLMIRTGLSGESEFGQLGRKLDVMAAALQRNEFALHEEIIRGRKLQDQQVTMLHELNHRVKNTLATVQSLARQSARGGEGQAVQFEARILSLSKTHDLLTREDWSGASLREVLENELSPYRADADHIVLAGAEVALSPRHVLALGMTIHELATNAAKYGALSTTAGHIELVWRVETREGSQRWLRLTWRESGGPAVVPPTRRGFGTRLITGGVQRELAGKVELTFDPRGLRCRIDVPLVELGVDMLIPTQ